jgi:hypothetical protein
MYKYNKLYDEKITNSDIIKAVREANKAKDFYKRLEKDLNGDKNFVLRFPNYKGNSIDIDINMLNNIKKICDNALDKDLIEMLRKCGKIKRRLQPKGLGSATNRIVYFKYSPLYDFITSCNVGNLFALHTDTNGDKIFIDEEVKLLDCLPELKNGYATVSTIQDIYAIHKGYLERDDLDLINKHFNGNTPPFFYKTKEGFKKIYPEGETDLPKNTIGCINIFKQDHYDEKEGPSNMFQFYSLFYNNIVSLDELESYSEHFDKKFNTEEFTEAKKILLTIKEETEEGLEYKEKLLKEKEFVKQTKQRIQNIKLLELEHDRIEKLLEN